MEGIKIGTQTLYRIVVAPLLILLALLVFLPGAARPAKSTAESPQSGAQQIGDNHIGFVWVNGPGCANASLRYQQAVSAGAHWTRWPIYWDKVEATQGTYDFSQQDSVVYGDLNAGLQINGIIVGTPAWAATSGLSSLSLPPLGRGTRGLSIAGISPLEVSSAASPPMNLDKPVFSAPEQKINQDNYWARFVYDTVKRYKDKVRVWEMWNEPDAPDFWSGGDAKYELLLKVGYQAAKAADPTVTVLFGGLWYWIDPTFFPRVLTIIARDPEARANNYFFDGVAYHPYTSVYNVPNFATLARSQMAAAGIPAKPLWFNETNIPVCDDTPGHSCAENNTLMGTMEQQAAYWIQVVALAAASGVDKIFFHQLYDDGLTWPAYGIIRNDSTPRPAYYAYQTAATYLANPSAVTRRDLGNAEIIGLNSAGLGKVTVAWSKVRASVPVSIVAVNTRAELRDKYGQLISVVQPSGGCYRLTLPAATDPYPQDSTVAHVGGDPYLLIERGAFAQALGGSESSAAPTYAAGGPLSGITASTPPRFRIIFPFVPVGLVDTGC
jgi:hypothetical protein